MTAVARSNYEIVKGEHYELFWGHNGRFDMPTLPYGLTYGTKRLVLEFVACDLIVGSWHPSFRFYWLLRSSTLQPAANFFCCPDQGVNFQSLKYGNIQGWRPDRCKWSIQAGVLLCCIDLMTLTNWFILRFLVCSSVAEAADIEYSYVVVTTKAIPEITRTPQILAPFLTNKYGDKFKQPVYVFMQNGLNVEVDLYNELKDIHPTPERSILSTAVWIGTNLVEPNVVEHGDFVRVRFTADWIEDPHSSWIGSNYVRSLSP